jgi:lipopolysaccharide export LptBFGC system permease protein LptF
MQVLSRIDWYITREIISLALVIVAVVSSVMFVFRIFAFADYVFLSQDALSTVFLFVVFLLPTIFKLTIPLSLLLATLIVTLRMSQDREIEALLSCGASVLRLARAPTILGLLGMLTSMYTAFFLEPMSREQLGRFKWMQAVRGIENFVESRLDEKTFLTDVFPLDHVDVSLFVERLVSGRRGEMEGVLLNISDPRSKIRDDILLVARKGSIYKEEGDTFPDYVFRFEDGRIYQPSVRSPDSEDLEPQGRPKATVRTPVLQGSFVGPLPADAHELLTRAGDWEIFRFQELKVSMFSLFRRESRSDDESEVNIRTLPPRAYWTELKKRRMSQEWGRDRRIVRDHTYFYEAFTVPLACLFLPVVGICMGVCDPRRRPGHAYLGVGLFVLVFYATLMLCQQLALRYVIGPETTLWFPPLVLAALTAWIVRVRVIYPPSASFLNILRFESAVLLTKGRRWFGAGT